MEKKLLIILFLMLLLPTAVLAVDPAFTFKQNRAVDLCIPQFNENNSQATAGTTCFLTLKNPLMEVMIEDKLMEFKSDGLFCYDINNSFLNTIGNYPTTVRCNTTIDHSFSSFTTEVTPTGFTGTLGFYILILGLSLGIIVLGFWKQDAPIVILGSFGLYFVGLYILYFGISGIKDPVYTWAPGIIILMVAAYISVKSAYELIVD